MNQIYVGIFKPPRWQKNPIMWMVDKLIQFRTWSPYTHVALILSYRDREIISATWPKIKRENVSEYAKGTKVEVYEIECSTKQAEKVRQWFLSRERQAGYDLPGLIGFIVRGKIEDEKKFFCSEAFVTACYAAGIEVFAPKRCPAYKVAPGTLRWSPRLKFVEVWKI